MSIARVISFSFNNQEGSTPFTLFRDALCRRPESLLCNLGETKVETDPICLDLSSVHWNPLMLSCIEHLYESEDAKIRLPQEGVELEDLLPVLEYLNLLPQEGDLASHVEYAEAIDPAVRLRAKAHLLILQCIQETASRIETVVERATFQHMMVVLLHDGHDAYDIKHNTDDVYIYFKDDRWFKLRKNGRFRKGLEEEMEQRLGLMANWETRNFITSVPVNAASEEELRQEDLVVLNLEIPQPPPKRQKTDFLSK